MEKISKKNKVLGLKSFRILLSMVFYCNYNTYAVEENQKNEENQKTEIEDFIDNYQGRLRKGWCSCCMDIDLSKEEKKSFYRIKNNCLNFKQNEEEEEKRYKAEYMAKEYKKEAKLFQELADKNNVSRENKELLNFHINCNNDVSYEIDLAFEEKNYIYREMIANDISGGDNIEIFVPFIFNEQENEDIFSNVIKSIEEEVDCGPYSFANLNDLLKSALLYLKDTSWRNSRIVTVDFLKLLYFYLYAFNWDEDGKMSNNSSSLGKEREIQEDLPIEINPCVFYYKKVKIQGKVKDICAPQSFNKFSRFLRLDFSKLIGDYFPKKLIRLLTIKDWKKKKIRLGEEFYNDKYLIYYLKLDLNNPDCIALLEHVGKGNYGVVKKGLIKTNYGYEPVAIKFTCVNCKYENAEEKNIENEILAGAVLKLTGITDVASVEKFITIDSLIKHPKKIEKNETITVNLGDTNWWDIKEDYRENHSWGLNNTMDEFLNEKNDRLPEDKKNVKEAFENNVFNKNRIIGKYDSLYIMFMKYVNGKDLFYDNKKVNLDYLGKKLFYFLCKGEQYNISFNDIKPKNIMKGEKSFEFTLIDLQTLSKKTGDLSNTLGTPEYWPFFKTLNLSFFRNYSYNGYGVTEIDRLYDDSINSNFVDIYAACMTMYFTKFHTFTAAGLLTLLLKWMVLEKENAGKDGWENFSLNDKINFLKDYNKNYLNYISLKNHEKEYPNYILLENEGTKSNNKTVFFFENIDDRNLNKEQKRTLMNYLLKVLTIKNNEIFISDVDDFFKKFCQYDSCDDGPEKISVNNDDLGKILSFFKERVFTDFKNFKLLEKCPYKDIIKYVLCFGSFLDYNNVRNKNMLIPQNGINNNNKNEIIENIYNIDNDENEKNINDDFNLDLFLDKLELKKDIKDKGTDFFKHNQGYKQNKNISEIVNILKNSFDQTFMKKLLEILDYKIWNDLKVLSVRKEIIEYHLSQYFDKNQKIFNEKYKEKMLKVFYLMKVLDKKNLLIFPCDIKKLLMFVKDNNDKELDESDEEI